MRGDDCVSVEIQEQSLQGEVAEVVPPCTSFYVGVSVNSCIPQRNEWAWVHE